MTIRPETRCQPTQNLIISLWLNWLGVHETLEWFSFVYPEKKWWCLNDYITENCILCFLLSTFGGWMVTLDWDMVGGAGLGSWRGGMCWERHWLLEAMPCFFKVLFFFLPWFLMQISGGREALTIFARSRCPHSFRILETENHRE
jgi:hypothetical protein